MVDPSIIPEVQRDIYYGTHVSDLQDGVPKHNGLISSYLGLALPVTGVLALPGQSVGRG